MSVSFNNALTRIKTERPLIHVISNYVTLNDVVNVILAAGATAIAADDPQEAEQITALSRALYLNTGMPSDRKLEAMIRAGKTANCMGTPVVLDPVGAGASDYRQQFLKRILEEVHITCIRGNASEIAALSGITFRSGGVESTNITEPVTAMQNLSQRLQCILAVSGHTDLVVTPDSIHKSEAGSPLAKRVTGCGCMLSGLVAAFLSLYPSLPVREQALLVHQVMENYGLAQERAQTSGTGTMTFRSRLIDNISNWGNQNEQ